ncbi:MAG: MBL fold metallo-hydrolase [Alloprevotella sp.]|nr:MBL fold metallo-hydrolase [Bacteroidales bacterium]MDY3942626.1 MBL fold metallo-hydrolase [Alloprevotella sp.]
MGRLTFLGTGTSSGVPMLGCDCETCTSTNVHDHRLRTSALLETNDGVRVLFDCGPDFRQQMLQVGFKPFDAIVITHDHYDHIGGLDDLRPSRLFEACAIYAEPSCVESLRQRLPYCFAEKKYPGVPRLDLRTLEVHRPVEIGAVSIVPFRILHGNLPIVGFRYGDFAYITDMKTIPEEEMTYLKDVRTLVVNALRIEAHHSHLSLQEALGFAQKVGAEATYFTHIAHSLGPHDAVSKQLPANVFLAYDGLQIEI